MVMSTLTVAGINPALNILGATQQFNYTQSLSALQLTNSFIPTSLISAQTNFEVRNTTLSGFRWAHLTSNTDTYGSLTLQSFVGAATSGTTLMNFTSSGIGAFAAINMNSNKITSLTNPSSAQDAATKNYVDTSTITLSGAVTGSGNVNSTISTTLTPITVSQITDFTTAVLAFRLDQFAAPTSNVSFNSHKITNLLDPTLAQDAATKNYVDTNVAGYVVGPGSAVSNNVATYNGTTGKIIQDSGVAAASIVLGPGSAVSNNVATYNGTTGKLIKDSGIAISAVVTATSGGGAATAGIGTLNGTTGVTVSTTAVTTSSIVNVTRNNGASGAPLGTSLGELTVASIVASTSFIVYSTNALDVFGFSWQIVNP